MQRVKGSQRKKKRGIEFTRYDGFGQAQAGPAAQHNLGAQQYGSLSLSAPFSQIQQAHMRMHGRFQLYPIQYGSLSLSSPFSRIQQAHMRTSEQRRSNPTGRVGRCRGLPVLELVDETAEERLHIQHGEERSAASGDGDTPTAAPSLEEPTWTHTRRRRHLLAPSHCSRGHAPRLRRLRVPDPRAPDVGGHASLSGQPASLRFDSSARADDLETAL
ncbi:unnamed protein product [Urochloa humidicola]